MANEGKVMLSYCRTVEVRDGATLGGRKVQKIDCRR